MQPERDSDSHVDESMTSAPSSSSSFSVVESLRDGEASAPTGVPLVEG